MNLKRPALERMPYPGISRLRPADPPSDRESSQIVGRCAAIQRVRATIERAADESVPVLLFGATGTGKALAARSIHERGAGAGEPFVTINCAAGSPSLIEKSLVGHVGAGTLFLDEIGELPLEAQPTLLRVLEDEMFRARVVAATSTDIEVLAGQGKFRLDLLHRINTITIRLPTLAERGRPDVELLLRFFVSAQKRRLAFTPEAIAWLSSRPWPGNVRELSNTVSRLAILSERDVVDITTVKELAPPPTADSNSRMPELIEAVLTGPIQPGRSRYRELERALIQGALDLTEGNVAAAARLLGIPRKPLTRRRARLGLPDGDDL